MEKVHFPIDWNKWPCNLTSQGNIRLQVPNNLRHLLNTLCRARTQKWTYFWLVGNPPAKFIKGASIFYQQPRFHQYLAKWPFFCQDFDFCSFPTRKEAEYQNVFPLWCEKVIPNSTLRLLRSWEHHSSQRLWFSLCSNLFHSPNRRSWS